MNRVASIVDAAAAIADVAAGAASSRTAQGSLGTLTTRQAQRLAALRYGARLLDSAFRVPGTSRRIGIDPLIGLFPGSGDLVSPLFTIAVLWHAREMGVPRSVQARMLYNAALDGLCGTVPLIGDLFDFAWKANQRNVALLEQYAGHGRPTFGDRLFAAALIAALVAIAAVPILLTAALIAFVGGSI